MPALLMPNVGEGVTEGTVVRWLKHEGDAVRLDEVVLEVETDKAFVEVPSPFEGQLTRILVQEGEAAKIGVPLAEFDTAASATADRQATPATNATAAPAADAAGVPNAQTPPEASGPGAAALPRPAPATARPNGSQAQVTDTPRSTPSAQPLEGPSRRSTFYSPLVQRLAADRGIDLASIEGTGAGGRITRRDVLRNESERGTGEGHQPSAAAAPAAPSATANRSTAAAATEPSVLHAEDDEFMPLSRMHRTIAGRMTEAHQTIPAAWMAIEADVSGLVALRERQREEFERREGVHLTYLPFLVEAIMRVLKSHPRLNASFSEDGVTVHHRYHVGIAVSTPAGLMVPVVKDADQKSVAELAREITALAEKARNRRIAIDQLRGATLTIDNTGAFGSVISQPIIPPGQVAILTTEAIRRVVRVRDDGSLAVRSVMYMAISFDHRALDGADAGAFMHDVLEAIEAIGPDEGA